LFFVWLYRVCPSALNAIAIIQPGTIIRWHRTGFRLYWRWRSRAHGGRPKMDRELRALIREISVANPLWGAPPIHGELLKLGFTVAQSTMFVAPTATFKLLYGMVILHHQRRSLVSFGVTSNPTAEWMARQISDPRYVLGRLCREYWDGEPDKPEKNENRSANHQPVHCEAPAEMGRPYEGADNWRSARR